MSMEFAAWNSLYSVMTAQQDRRPFSWATVRRILTFVRPRRRMLAGFLALSVVGAMLAVATPLLAGQVVDALVNRQSFTIVWQFAMLIAVIALAEAGVGLLARWLSARIGEGLILDLRQAVFDHVQRMPIAFFTRTRTGALVSRLNNDVIGAQRAFSDTLSGVVGNLVALALTLVVMLRISWEITVLALVLLPIFVLPARRMGRRLARMELEAANHNSVMSTQMTERFSAPGRDPGEAVRPARARVGGVRRPGEAGPRHRRPHRHGPDGLHDRVDAGLLARAGPGLRARRLLRPEGSLEPGMVVALALLITRLYAPLTGLASARVEVMSALVSFERVFEILDLKPLITEKPDARSVPAGPVGVAFDHVSFRLPVGGQGVARLAGGGVGAGHPRWGRGDPRCHLPPPSRARWWPWSARPGPGKSTIASAGDPALRRRRRTS